MTASSPARLLALLLSSAAAMATVLGPEEAAAAAAETTRLHEPRAAAVAPDGYAPQAVDCPSPRPAVRNATGISPQEEAWLPRRSNDTVAALKALLGRADLGGFDAGAWIDGLVANGSGNGSAIGGGRGDGARLPRIAVAVSGGGYRALMNGAGALAAFDNRTTNATSPGQLGGLLQAATYLSGLSGGSWLVGSLYVQNFTTVESIVSATDGFLSRLWRFDDSILQGPAGLGLGDYYAELRDSVEAKADAGFNTTITDYWGRALSYQLVNASDGGPAYTFSSIANDTDFAQAQAPMPIVVALQRDAGQVQIAANATVFEFNPWEMGSYDAGAAAFAPLAYAGSNFSGGVVVDGPRRCVAGQDNAGFVMGTSSSLFNQALLRIGSGTNGSDPGLLISALNRTLGGLASDNNDVARWPNPFRAFDAAAGNVNADARLLTLVDGGEALENLPLHPLLLAERRVDVIFAVDSSADTPTSWPNGTSLVATYAKSRAAAANSSSSSSSASAPASMAPFPPVPDQNTFVNLGLNARPTFFGCNNDSTPLVVYLPNHPYTAQSNVSTFDLEYSITQRDRIIQNGFNVATMANASLDAAWPACVACAVLARSLARAAVALPGPCSDCFDRYCWNGTTNSTEPLTYQPAQLIAVAAGPRQPASAPCAVAVAFALSLLLWAL